MFTCSKESSSGWLTLKIKDRPNFLQYISKISASQNEKYNKQNTKARFKHSILKISLKKHEVTFCKFSYHVYLKAREFKKIKIWGREWKYSKNLDRIDITSSSTEIIYSLSDIVHDCI